MPGAESKIRFPAEWETQSGVMLTWPHAHSDWCDLLDEIEPVYTAICKAICTYETCLVICFDDAHLTHVREHLGENDVKLENCLLVVCQSNDTWCRDYGPITTWTEDKTVLNNFMFNAWGGKYNASLDDAVTDCLAQQHRFTTAVTARNFVLEGGSIETDGAGTVLTTSHCLLKRHPGKTKNEFETFLQATLGASRFLWLDAGSLGGDDTDSHIDNLARFANVETILYSACNDDQHPDYAALASMQTQLKSFRQENGHAYELVPVYIPEPIYVDGQPLPASYVNYLVINHAVLVPQFGKEQDAAAMTVFQQYFPGHEIIGINSMALIKQFGGIHCATMHFPQDVLNQDKTDT